MRWVSLELPLALLPTSRPYGRDLNRGWTELPEMLKHIAQEPGDLAEGIFMAGEQR